MPRKQTRRSISVSSATYDRLTQYCEKTGTTRSRFVEDRIKEFFTEKNFYIGARVNYHAMVGGPVTLPNTVIVGGPYKQGDHVSWRVKGKPGTIDEAALSSVG